MEIINHELTRIYTVLMVNWRVVNLLIFNQQGPKTRRIYNLITANDFFRHGLTQIYTVLSHRDIFCYSHGSTEDTED
jgi:hypothetical protein